MRNLSFGDSALLISSPCHVCEFDFFSSQSMILHNAEFGKAFIKAKWQKLAASISYVKADNFSVQILGKINQAWKQRNMLWLFFLI